MSAWKFLESYDLPINRKRIAVAGRYDTRVSADCNLDFFKYAWNERRYILQRGVINSSTNHQRNLNGNKIRGLIFNVLSQQLPFLSPFSSFSLLNASSRRTLLVIHVSHTWSIRTRECFAIFQTVLFITSL